jgi:hypothetical protein
MVMGESRRDARWELAYPTTFFASLTARTPRNLKTYLESNDLDPYAFSEFGTIWKRVALKQ